MGGVMGMLPGIGKLKNQINEAGLTKDLKRQQAIIGSMTPKERRSPKVLDAKRKRRIAAGSGTTPADINKLLKMHMQMADVMKQMGRNPGMMNKMAGMMGLPAGGGGGPSQAEIAQMQAELGKLDPKALEQLPDELKQALPTGPVPKTPLKGLPGLGGGLTGLPGLGGGFPKFPGLPGKKR